MPKDQRKKFTIEETVRALALWSSQRYQVQFNSTGSGRPNKVFDNLSTEMKASGFNRSSYELRKLVETLTVKYYKKVADRTGTKVSKSILKLTHSERRLTMIT